MKYSVKIGITVLAAVLVVYLGSLFLKKSYKKIVGEIHHYEIFFDNVNGLKKEDPVKIFGYTVGQVKDIALTDSGAIVKIEVYKKLPLKKDATAEIQIKELLTGKQIVIFPGESGKPFDNKLILGKRSHDFSSLTSKMGTIAEEIPEKAVVNLFNRVDSLSIALQKLTKLLDADKIQRTWYLLDENLALLLKIERDLYKYNSFSLITKTNKTLDSLQIFMLETKKLITTTTTLLQDYEKNKEKIHKTMELLPQTLQQTNETLVEVNNILKSDSSIVRKALYDKKLHNKLNYLISKIDTTLTLLNSGNLRIGISLKNRKKKK